MWVNVPPLELEMGVLPRSSRSRPVVSVKGYELIELLYKWFWGFGGLPWLTVLFLSRSKRDGWVWSCFLEFFGFDFEGSFAEFLMRDFTTRYFWEAFWGDLAKSRMSGLAGRTLRTSGSRSAWNWDFKMMWDNQARFVSSLRKRFEELPWFCSKLVKKFTKFRNWKSPKISFEHKARELGSIKTRRGHLNTERRRVEHFWTKLEKNLKKNFSKISPKRDDQSFDDPWEVGKAPSLSGLGYLRVAGS